MASVSRYSPAVASSCTMWPSAVLARWNVHGMNAVNPPVSSCRLRTSSRWFMRCSMVSPQPKLIGAVVRMPSWGAGRAAEGVGDVARASNITPPPAAGNGIKSRSHQPPDGLAQAQPADLRDIGDFGCGETVQVNGEALLDAAEEVLVPLDFEIGVQATLHQHTGPAQVERLLDFFENRLLGQHVPFRVAHGAVERAEAAVFGAEVGVVDIAIDDVRGDALGMPLAADGIGLHADADQVVRTEQIEHFLASDHAVIPRYQTFPREKPAMGRTIYRTPNIAWYFSGSRARRISRLTKMWRVCPVASVRSPSASRIS